MTLKEEFNNILLINEISIYLSNDEKQYIVDYYDKFDNEFKKIYEVENDKKKIAIVIFYNIILSNKDLKNRKNSTNKALAFSMKSLGAPLNISEKSFRTLNNNFYKKFDQFQQSAKDARVKVHGPEDEVNRKEISSLVKIIIRTKRKTETQQLNKSTLIKMLSYTLEYIKILYCDKDAIKIKDYLGHLLVNLYISGYKVEESKIEELFGDFYRDSGLVLTDGRNHDDFVKVKDIYGNTENKVYIDFRR